MQRNCVISFFNTPSGLFSWWDQLSLSLTTMLAELGCDHIVYFRSFTENSVYSPAERRVATNADLNDSNWVTQNLQPICLAYSKVIIHTHSHYPPLKVKSVLQSGRIVWCATEHRIGNSSEFLIKQLIRKSMRKIGYFPQYFIGVSNAVKMRNSSMYGKENQFTILNGIKIPEFLPQHIPFNRPAKNALYVGRLDPKKGIWNLIKAFEIINRHHPELALTLTVVGGGVIWQELVDYINKHQLGSIINLVGYKTDPSPFYSQADFVVIPTVIQEAMSLTSLEARLHGTPTLYANCGGLPETQIDGLTGMMLSGTGPEELAANIIRYVSDVPLQQHVIQHCRTGIENFAEHRMVTEYRDFYQYVYSELS
jgi:glycosyltransferase involved in cell wall biosynthesis